MKKNCVNCGAPFEYEHNKCPFCGTTYFDNFVTLDLVNNTPVVFKAKTHMGIISMLCQPKASDMNMTMSYDSVDCANISGINIGRYCTGRNLDLDLSFSAIPMWGDESLVTIEYKEDK